jgi:Acyl-CoA reductase (LuxC)
MPFDLDAKLMNSAFDNAELDAVTVFAPTAADVRSFLRATSAVNYCPPFDPALIEVLAGLSKQILANPVLKQNVGCVALAYWLRKANLQRLKQAFDQRTAQLADADAVTATYVVPVGQVLHIAPANVDTLFVYSWALSFICGNYNIVRVSERQSPIVTELMGCLNQLMLEAPLLRDRNRFVTYAHQGQITAELSQWCNHRVVWGGDDTVRAIRAVPLNPHASERVFSSKFSYALLDAAAVQQLSETTLGQLAANFFNDMFVFDQMACSSPHIVFWLGDAATMAAVMPQFNAALEREITRRDPQDVSIATAVKRFNTVAARVIDEDLQVDRQYRGFIALAQRQGPIRKDHSGSGILNHCHLAQIQDIVQFATCGDQTITHFGLTAAQLQELAYQVGTRGVDRLVPVGQALNFSPDWDGYNLLDDFTRRVVVQGR